MNKIPKQGYVYARANGGFLTHVLLLSTLSRSSTAACGHTPADNSKGVARRRMKPRGGWRIRDRGEATEHAMLCKKCEEAMDKVEATQGAAK